MNEKNVCISIVKLFTLCRTGSRTYRYMKAMRGNILKNLVKIVIGSESEKLLWIRIWIWKKLIWIYNSSLKGQSHEIFDPLFFSLNCNPGSPDSWAKTVLHIDSHLRRSSIKFDDENRLRTMPHSAESTPRCAA
jgi:hypothetical protein